MSSEVDIKRFVTGPIETNTYVVSERGQSTCLVIDPSSGCDEVLTHIYHQRLWVEAVCLTHGHFDHVLGVEEITAEHPKATVWIHADGERLLGDPYCNGSVMLGMNFRYTGTVRYLVEGPMTIGAFQFGLLHIPGHSPGGCALLFGGNCISGDAVFADSIGRTDFPGCDGRLFLKNIRDKLLVLPDETVIWPGHGGRTTVGREKRHNPYFS